MLILEHSAVRRVCVCAFNRDGEFHSLRAVHANACDYDGKRDNNRLDYANSVLPVLF